MVTVGISKVTFKSRFALTGGACYCLALKWIAHNKFKRKMRCYCIGNKYERYLINGKV